MSKVRIVSDGDGTAEITDAETGALIPGVTSVMVEMRPGKASIARLETSRAAVDVVAEVADASVAQAIIRDLCDTEPFHDDACIYCGVPSLIGQLFGPEGYDPDGQHFARRNEHKETCVWRRALDMQDGADDGPHG